MQVTPDAYGVPQDDGGDQEVETGCFVDLMLVTANAHFTELVEEDAACENYRLLNVAFCIYERGFKKLI